MTFVCFTGWDDIFWVRTSSVSLAFANIWIYGHCFFFYDCKGIILKQKHCLFDHPKIIKTEKNSQKGNELVYSVYGEIFISISLWYAVTPKNKMVDNFYEKLSLAISLKNTKLIVGVLQLGKDWLNYLSPTWPHILDKKHHKMDEKKRIKKQ